MALRQLWKMLSVAAFLVTAMVFGVSTSAAAGDTEACAGDVVVALDVRVKDRPGHDTWPIALPAPLPPGEWSVEARSFNGYEGREEVTQPAEQWVLEVVDHLTLGPTTDLADEVTEAEAVDQLGTFVTDAGVTDLVVRHRHPDPDSGPNSVVAVCVGFTAVPPPPPTLPPTTQPPTTLPPTTQPPTTLPPTTQPPTTQPPTTLPPATVPPTTLPPTSPAPTPPPPAVPPSPLIGASATVDCARGEVLVLVGNQGTAGTTVDVALPRADLRSGLAVEAGALTTTTLALAGLEDTDTEVRVSDAHTGEVYVRTPVSVDCTAPPAPTATVVLDCPSDSVIVHLANLEGAPALLTVVHERVVVAGDFALAAGETAEVAIELEGAARVPIRVVDADGADVVRIEVVNECPGGEPADDGPPAGPSGEPEPPVAITTDCAAVALSGPAPYGVGVEVDGAVLIEGEAGGDVVVPLVPGVATKVVVERGGEPAQVVIPATPGCAEVTVVIEPDCAAASADVTIEREGSRRERFVVLTDSRVAGVAAIDGSGAATIPVRLGGGGTEIAIARSFASAPIDLVVPCPARDGPAGAVAASLVVVAVIATAAGVWQWPNRWAG